jgi:glycosyltransferase involved in cell wall biosynthesis
MKIGFDAKRAFNNSTGLGHYSRTLITSLAAFYPEHNYYLFSPAVSDLFDTSAFKNIQTITPVNFPDTVFSKKWRSQWVTNDLKRSGIELYHGLSHQIPLGIKETGIPSVVTIHDLIFERYPEQHGPINVLLYRRKFKYACKNADAIIAISEQTKNDLIKFYKVPPQKIHVCYQSCDASFMQKISEPEKQNIKIKYDLPEQYFLSVGSITERKNLLTVCKALNNLKSDLKIPLVVIGTGRKYKEQIKIYLKENNIEHLVIFLNDHPAAETDRFKTSADFPAIYQNATALIYPSVFEGFGIPILEALWSGLPTIISNVSCMPETGGDAALYIKPFDEAELSEKMKAVAENILLRKEMIEKGFAHAQKFLPQKCAAAVMNVYKQIAK